MAAADAFFFRTAAIIMRSTKSQRLPLASPRKTTVRKSSSTSSLRTMSPHKQRSKQKPAPLAANQSVAGLVSSFRKISLAPTPHPPLRSKSTSPRKPKLNHVRGLDTNAVKSVEDIVDLIKTERCKNIIVMAGAGISTPSGIPDFRTPGTGLYDNLQQYKIPEPSAIFDVDYFWYDPRPFFCLAKSLYPGNYQPNYVHYFVKLLHDNGLLLRMYTQNIDGLERLADIPAAKLVEAHGTFSTASCIRCHKSYDGEQIKKTIMKGDIPKCSSPRCTGVIKPDIVFFGEDLPKRFYSYIVDFPKCDLLVIMGTSLEVEPFAGIANTVDRSTPRLLLNREIVGPFSRRWERRSNDIVQQGDVVDGVKKLVSLLGWSDSMDAIMNRAKEKWKDHASTLKVNVGNTSVEIAKTMEKTSDGVVDEKDNAAQERTEPKKIENGVHLGNSCGAKTAEVTNGSGQLSPFGSRKLHSLTNGFVEKGVVYRTDKNLFLKREGPMRSNLATQRASLLPFRYTQRNELKIERQSGDFKVIDPCRDLACAGFGLGKRSMGLGCFLAGTAGQSSSDED